MQAEDIIKKHAPDWNNWHEQCRKQVLAAMEEYRNTCTYKVNGVDVTSDFFHAVTRRQL